MLPLSLKQFVRKKGNQSLLTDLAASMSCSWGIYDIDGTCLIDHGLSSNEEVREIRLNEHLLGHLYASQHVDVMERTLIRMLSDTYDKKSLAKEALTNYQELNLFYRLPRKMHDCRSIAEAAQLALDEVCQIMGQFHASVMIENASHELELVASLGFDLPEKARTFSKNEGVAGQAFRTQEPQVIYDIKQHSTFIDNKYNIQSLMCVPIKSDDAMYGVMNISSKEKCTFSSHELQMAIAVATQTAAVIENFELENQRFEQARIRNHLQRYVSDHIVNSILDEGAGNILLPRRQVASSLFSDIRNFTSICEAYEAENIVENLNVYFDKMVKVVFEHGGTVDKFVGDMVVAFFNAPSSMEEHQATSIRTAIAMQQELSAIELPWIRENIRIGIGLNTGAAVVGNIGAEDHCDYTAIGDTINTSARLQGMAEAGEILVSQAMYESCREQFQFKDKGTMVAKGKLEPIQVYSVVY